MRKVKLMQTTSLTAAKGRLLLHRSAGPINALLNSDLKAKNRKHYKTDKRKKTMKTITLKEL